MSPKLRIDDDDIEIIEENHEKDLNKVLKSKISWMKVFKVLFIVIVVGIIVYYTAIGGFPSDIFVYILLVVCIIGAAVLISIDDEDEDYYLTISVVKCLKCNFQKITRFVDGDAFFQMKGQCPDCQGNLQIAEIYSVKLAEEMEEKSTKSTKTAKTEETEKIVKTES